MVIFLEMFESGSNKTVLVFVSGLSFCAGPKNVRTSVWRLVKLRAKDERHECFCVRRRHAT